jgi:hypothetical protein
MLDLECTKVGRLRRVPFFSPGPLLPWIARLLHDLPIKFRRSLVVCTLHQRYESTT